METKPRMLRVTSGDERKYLMLHIGCLDVPSIVQDHDGSVWADADELRAWRKLRESQNQSEVEPK
jgi:hypothetical protein